METPWRHSSRLLDGAFAYMGDDRAIRAYPVIDHTRAQSALLRLNQWVQYQEEYCPLFINWTEVEQVRARIQAVLDSKE